MLRLDDHVVEEEKRRLAQHGIGARPQKLHVGVEGVVVPHLQRDPDAGGDEDAPAHSPPRRRIAPGIRNRVDDPSGRAVHLARRGAAGCAHRIDQSEERRLTLREICNLGRPVILLRVDVEMKVVGPTHAAGEAVIPDALQGKRQLRAPA